MTDLRGEVKSRLTVRTRALIVGVGLAAIGTALGVLGSAALGDDRATDGVAADGTPTCSIYEVPSLASMIVPMRSTLADGSPYVIVCRDSDGREVFNEVFIHQLDR